MSTRSKWTAIPGLLALAIGAVLLSAYSGASSAEGRGPAQPIDFPHPVHVQQLGMNCLYCHNAANKSPDAGLPAMSTCAGCHNAAAVTPKLRKIGDRDTTTSEPLTKLFEYMDVAGGGANMKPVPWVRIHKVPDYVQFPHMRHVNAGVTCQSCHGKIQEMDRVYQAASLNMGWCVRCHVNGYNEGEGLKAEGKALQDQGRSVVGARKVAQGEAKISEGEAMIAKADVFIHSMRSKAIARRSRRRRWPSSTQWTGKRRGSRAGTAATSSACRRRSRR